MKKILLGTTALVATGLTAGTASAAALKVDVNGYYTGLVAAVDSSWNATEDVQVKHEGEISVNGAVTLDNGMTAGVEINIEATNSASVPGIVNSPVLNGAVGTVDGVAGIDEAYAYLEGSFGRVQVGSEASAPFLMHFSAPYFVGSHGVDSPNFGYHANLVSTGPSVTSVVSVGGSARTATYITISGDNNKITYFSPRFSGVQLGISYTPDNMLNRDAGGQRGGRSNNFASPIANLGPLNFTDVIEVGANYTGTFQNVGIGASVGYAVADTASTPGGGSAGVQDPEAWSFGLQLTSGAFTLGGGYYMSENLASIVAAGAPDLEEKAYSVALQYETGPWTVGAGYFKSKNEVTPTVDDEYEVIEVGATYALGEGVDVFAVAEFYESSTTGVPLEAETDAFGLGIDLAF